MDADDALAFACAARHANPALYAEAVSYVVDGLDELKRAHVALGFAIDDITVSGDLHAFLEAIGRFKGHVGDGEALLNLGGLLVRHCYATGETE